MVHHTQIAVLVALAGGVFSAATPSPYELSTRACPLEMDYVSQSENIFNQLINNATYLLTWRLVPIAREIGAASNPASLRNFAQDACNNFAAYSQRWSEVGLNVDVLRIAFCGTRNTCSINDNTDNVLTHINNYITEITILQLLNVFNNTEEALRIVCKELDPSRVQALLFGNTNVIKTVCAAAHQDANNEPITLINRIPQIDPLELKDLQKTASELFAWELLGTLPSSLTVKSACKQDRPSFSWEINKINLNFKVISDIICLADRYTAFPSAEEVKKNMARSSTHVFVIMLWNLGTSQAYYGLLCTGFERMELTVFSGYGAMNVGLDWELFALEILGRCAALGKAGAGLK